MKGGESPSFSVSSLLLSLSLLRLRWSARVRVRMHEDADWRGPVGFADVAVSTSLSRSRVVEWIRQQPVGVCLEGFCGTLKELECVREHADGEWIAQRRHLGKMI